MPRKKPYRVGRSRTGLGLFATEPISKRAVIVEYKGPWLTNKEADRLEARGSRYLYEVNSRWTIDGSSRKNIGRYANHSCRPNAETHRLNGQVIVRAIKAINPGDEITYNYGRDYFLNVITPRGCKCVKCREKRREVRRAKRIAKMRRQVAQPRFPRAARVARIPIALNPEI
jgi:SET domain-containing protein